MRDPDDEALLAAAQSDYITRLAVVVLRNAFEEEGPDYAYTDGGEFWLSVVGVAPDVAYRLAGGDSLYRNLPDLSAPFVAVLGSATLVTTLR